GLAKRAFTPPPPPNPGPTPPPRGDAGGPGGGNPSTPPGRVGDACGPAVTAPCGTGRIGGPGFPTFSRGSVNVPEAGGGLPIRKSLPPASGGKAPAARAALLVGVAGASGGSEPVAGGGVGA